MKRVLFALALILVALPLRAEEQKGCVILLHGLARTETSFLVMEEALALATRLAAGPTAHFGMAKQAVLRAVQGTPWDSVLLETWGAEKVASLADSVEGRQAFREKREPRFLGR